MTDSDNRNLENSDDSLGSKRRRKEKKVSKWLVALIAIILVAFIGSLIAVLTDFGKKGKEAPPPASSTAINETQNAPTVTPPPSGRLENDLKLGDEGEAVKLLQYKLSQEGFYNGALTGFFNSGTEAALKAYQKAKGLKETGIADQDTRASLNGDKPQVKETVKEIHTKEVITNTKTVVDNKALDELQKKVDDLTDTNKDLQKKVDDLSKDTTPSGNTDTTSGTSAPTVVLGGTNSLGDTYASISGTVDSNGLETSYWVEYGLSSSSLISTGHLSNGNGTAARAITVSLSGLNQNTVYYYRLMASNSKGAIPSEIRTFTTSTSTTPTPNLNITVGISKFGVSSINGDLKVYVEATGVPDSGAKCSIEVQNNSSSNQPASTWSNGGEHVYNIPYQTGIYVRAVITYNGQNYYSSWVRYPQ